MASTIESINLTLQGMKDLLNDNASSIGDIIGVYERDEYPQVVLDTGKPAVYMLPMVNGSDVIDNTVGKSGISYHEFPVELVAFYRMNDVAEDLLTVREYGFNAYDLFKDNNNIAGGVFHNFEIEFGYFTVVDYIIHWWWLTIYVKKFVNIG